MALLVFSSDLSYIYLNKVFSAASPSGFSLAKSFSICLSIWPQSYFFFELVGYDGGFWSGFETILVASNLASPAYSTFIHCAPSTYFFNLISIFLAVVLFELSSTTIGFESSSDKDKS